MKIYNNITSRKFKRFLETEWNPDLTFLHHTGNMYGIGCSAFSIDALKRIENLKKRTEKKGFIVLIPELSWLERYNINISSQHKRLFQQYWPGNMSAILEDKKNIFKSVSENNKIAFRIPSSSFLREFLNKIDITIISTSINKTGEEPYSDLKKIIKYKKYWFDFGVLPSDNINKISLPSTIIDITGKEILCLREGEIKFENILRAYHNPLILFVCTGNICRSPMAEYLTRKMIKDDQLPFMVKSAGFLDIKAEISVNSNIILKEQGIDAQQHVSTLINKEIISNSWLILTMQEIQKKNILDIEPNAYNKVFTLSEYCGKEFCKPSCDIEDPYGLDIYFYRETFKMIKSRILALVNKLKKEVK